MTDSASGIDAIERRFERRRRSVRPPRRPREQAGADVEGATEPDRTDDSDESSEGPMDLQAVGAQYADDVAQRSTDQREADEQPRAALVGYDGQQQGQQGEQAEDLEREQDAQQTSGGQSTLLQRQVADAIAPVMADLQRQVADAVRQQVQQVVTREMGRKDAPPQVDEVSEPVHRQGEAQSAEQAEHQESGERSPLEVAIQRTVRALRQTLDGLVQMLKSLVQTVKALLTRLVSLLQTAVLRLGKALAFVARSIGRAIGAVPSALWNGLKSLLTVLLQKIVLAVLRSVLRSLLQRLTRALEEAPEQAEGGDAQTERAPEAA